MIGTLLLNRYELIEKIGEGGMGIVYKARCHLLNRFVAIKILKAELSKDEAFVAGFKREAKSAGSLSHPNIVSVHDVGVENHINFIVMEYINGKTLKQVIKEKGRLSPGETLDISLQIAKALECAHKNNIIHRDIKPDNILITDDNIVKVTDFGIAKVIDSATIANPNKFIGSAHYFSPEQAKGGLLDCRTDIYSLGIVMYEMLTGRVPYDSESSISIAMMHIQEPIIPPIEIITDIPENINQAILKSLEKEPIKRYQTAKEMIHSLFMIKEDLDFRVNLNNRSNDATMVMKPVIVTDTGNDITKAMSKVTVVETPISNKDKKIVSKNQRLSKHKKLLLIFGSIILVVMIVILGKYISKGASDVTKAPLKKTVVQKKLVPSVIGNTIDIAEHTIVSKGFTLGTISNDYSDNIANGLVISESPEINTPYEKGGKVDLVVSQGRKIVQVNVPELTGKTIEEAQKVLDDLQLKLGQATPVIVNDKPSKGNHPRNNNGQIFLQDKDVGTLVDIGTVINVSYYQNKRN